MKRSAVLALTVFIIAVSVFTSCETGSSHVISENPAMSDNANSASFDVSNGLSAPSELKNTSGESALSRSNSSTNTNQTSESKPANPTTSGNSASSASNYTSSSPNSHTSSNSNSSTNSNINSNTSSNTSSHSGSTSSDANSNPVGVSYLSVIDCVLTDKNCFVVVGTCEQGASVTALTDQQKVTVSSDHGYYSVRLKKLGTKTRVSLEAKGKFTEKYTFDAVPKVPAADMWPIVGANGYNFFFQKMMPDFMQTNLLSDSTLASLTQKTKNRVDNLKKVLPDTEIIYMIVPSRASIYPELVPSEYPKGTGKSRLEQVNEALEKGGAKVINLLDVFQKHKNDPYKLYWNTDSHWSDYGAFVAYTELFDYISKSFPAAAPRKMEEFDFICDFYNSGDMMLYMMMDQSAAKEYNSLRVPKFSMNKSIASVPRYRSKKELIYNDEVTFERVFQTYNDSLPNLYVIRDSYSTQIYDILADRGNTTYYRPMWNYWYDISDIKRNAPDYIIYIVAEWNIDVIINN